MIREIKFKYVYGIDGNEETYFLKTFTFGEIEGGCHFDEISDNKLLSNHEMLAKLQWSGLKDKYGVEIYEGDILNPVSINASIGNGRVIFHDGCFKVQHLHGEKLTQLLYENVHHYKVIGNIYKQASHEGEPIS